VSDAHINNPRVNMDNHQKKSKAKFPGEIAVHTAQRSDISAHDSPVILAFASTLGYFFSGSLSFPTQPASA
jgi:hypothetical protein